MSTLALDPRRTALLLLLWALPISRAHADDGVDHAFDVSRPRATLGVGYTLGASNSLESPALLSNFDPSDPRVGLILLAAYGPSPMLVVDGLAASSEDRSFTIAELLAASIGLVISVAGFADSMSRQPGAELSIGAMATAQAMAMNLQMMTNSVERLVFGNITGTVREAARPTFLPIPFQSGAGVVMRWND
jgi:hypothetical protein